MSVKVLREKVKKFRIVPFGDILHVIISNDLGESFEKRKLGTKVDLGSTYVAFVYTNTHDLNTYMFLPEDCSLSSVVHESVHVVANVMRHADVAFEEENWAYHLDEVFSRVSNILLPYQIQLKEEEKAKVIAEADATFANLSQTLLLTNP